MRFTNNRLRAGSELIGHLIVHTGQHYNEKMSMRFFEDPSIPRPHLNLAFGVLILHRPPPLGVGEAAGKIIKALVRQVTGQGVRAIPMGAQS